MRRLKSKTGKVILLIAITILVFILWQIGLESVHARILGGCTNASLHLFGSDKSIQYLPDDDHVAIFRIRLIKDGLPNEFKQEIGPLLQPTVIVLAWQLFLFLVLPLKKAFRLLLINLAIFIGLQVFFLIQLTGFHTSSFQKFLYRLMVDSFYIIALILLIKDNLLYPVFRKN
ncbi:MAG: hypothetical protein PHD61_05270 [Bacteroidales bacterium]|nr:hypothetical protein [Lentimicrobiaceae bacterium]MDD5694695.1 hypothetical protein [Bacteroidales bacterium]